MFYVLASMTRPTVYGPYADKATAEADARRVRLMDWDADAVDADAMRKAVQAAEFDGQRVVQRTAMAPR